MDERSFQGLPSVVQQPPHPISSTSSKKVYISPALVVLFHNVNVLVKALTLLFTQISTVLWKIVQVWPQKVQFDWLFSGSWISLLYSILQWFPRKFVTIDFSDCLADSSVSLCALSNIGSFMSSLIWGPSNIPALSFSMLICGDS